MSVIQGILSAISNVMAPDGAILRMRFRTRIDALVTLLVTILAVGLAIGYQVIGRWARRAGWVD